MAVVELDRVDVEPIAIVGIGCRFPMASGPEALWKLLTGGVDAVGDVPPDRWNVDRFYDASGAAGCARTRWGGFVDGIDLFDPGFFGISPREAVRIDPQQRLLLEVAWRALEDASTPVEVAASKRVGVFVGISGPDYWMLQLDPSGRRGVDAYSNIGGSLSVAANRVSHALGLCGPSAAIDAACASSLVAVSMACDAIRSGRCDMALAGGVNLLLKPELTVAFSQASMLSPRGRCRPFDAGADGYVRGEGAGLVLLKPLRQARAEGDRIYASVLGTAVNHNGGGEGIMVPNPDAQTAVILDALARSGRGASQVAYVESHGTGTPVGDPREAAALGQALCSTRETPLRIGSIKSNIGHLESAAGVAGLIKTALALHHGALPASLHFEEPNPKIAFEELGLEVQSSLTDWPDGCRLAGVNAFGFGGTNAHVVVEAAPPEETRPGEVRSATESLVNVRGDSGPVAWPISARSASALEELARTSARLAESGGGRAFAHAAATRRDHHAYRALVVAEGDGLGAALARIDRDEAVRVRAAGPGPLAFVFTGMGPQWWAMGRELIEQLPSFRAAIEACDRYFEPLAGWSLVEAMLADEESSRMSRTEVAQPANFAIQFALTDALARWGIRPDAIIGHSTGEVAAACAAGALDLADSVTLIYHRSRLQQRTAGRGSMLAVGLSAADASAAIREVEDRVSIAAINGPRTVTLAGDTTALGVLASSLDADGVFTRQLQVEVPYHSPAMDPLETELLEALASLRPRTPTTRLVSTVSPRSSELTLDAAYWWRNVREPVRFEAGVRQLLDEGVSQFVEIGPHPVLAASIQETAAGQGVVPGLIETLRRKRPERAALLKGLGRLYTTGHEIDWAAVYGGRASHHALPEHPFTRERYWGESPVSAHHRMAPVAGAFLHDPVPGPSSSWNVHLDRSSLAYLRDHRVQGRAILPAAGMLEALLEACRATSPEEAVLGLTDVRFERVLPLEGNLPEEVRVVSASRVELSSSGDGLSWSTHASGRPLHVSLSTEPLDMHLNSDGSGESSSSDTMYQVLREHGYDYGPAFQGLRSVQVVDRGAVGQVGITQVVSQDYVLHPALLDASFQALLAALPSSIELALPVGVNLVRVRAGAQLTEARVIVSDVEHFDRTIKARIQIVDGSGQLVAELRGLALRQLRSRTPDPLQGVLFGERLVPLPSFRSPSAASTAALDGVALETLQRRCLDLRERLGQDGFETEIAADLERLATAYGLDALQALGWHLEPGPCPDGVRLLVAPDRIRLFEHLQRIAEEEGLIEVAGGDVRGVRRRSLPSASDIRAELLVRHPSAHIELELLRRAGEALPDVLTGARNGVDVLFPGGGLSMLEQMYEDSRTFHVYSGYVREALAPLLKATVGAVDILEIGAGTGATCWGLSDLLPDRARYHFTDLSQRFLQHGRDKLGGRSVFKFGILDVEAPPEELLGSYDIVIAVNVLHATRDLRVSVRNAHELLRPGGTLVFVEIVRPRRDIDLIFGVTDGWWRFDDELRSRGPLMGVSEWRALLEESGFESPAVLGDTQQSFATMFIARRPDTVGASAKDPLTPPVEAVVKRGTWWLIGGEAGEHPRQGSIADAMRARDVEVERFPLRDLAARAASATPEGIIFCAGEGPRSIEAVQRRGCLEVVALVQKLEQAGIRRLEGLWLVTSGASEPDDPRSVLEWSMKGFGRVLMNEHPQLRPGLLDLGHCLASADYGLLVDVVLAGGDERELTVRDGVVYGTRVEAIDSSTLDLTRDVGAEVSALEPTAGGLVFSTRPRVAPLEDEVEIEVLASALNFRDLMLARGLLPQEALAHSYLGLRVGLECAGRVVSTGSGVSHVAEGELVVALAGGSLADRVVAHGSLVVSAPAGFSVGEAATLPTPYTTAYLALADIARVRPEERVLVHSAAGGVGLAAVHLARALGAVVVATAGTAAKRAYLRDLGIAQVYDSRTAGFGEVIRRAGGVDVVLNSLVGDAIDEGLRALVPGGRFVEIGKRDLFDHTPVDMNRLARNITFAVLDVDGMMARDRDRVGDSLRAVVELAGQGAIPPLPHRAHSHAGALELLADMGQGEHIGRLLVSRDYSGPLPEIRTPRSVSIREDGTYVITGGLGGFGLLCAGWLAERGAGHIVLIGRSGASTSEAREAVEVLRATGARVTVECADVSDREALQAALERARQSGAPVRGVFHAALVLRDAAILNIDEERWFEATRPKIEGAWNLHELTAKDPLDMFVLFSSGTLLLGNAGQASYGAANGFLKGLAAHRHAIGLPALAVHWGGLAEVGYVARHGDVLGILSDRLGLRAFSPGQAIDVLEGLLTRARTAEIAAMAFDWRRWESNAPIARSAAFVPVLSQSGDRMASESDAQSSDVGLTDVLEGLEGPAERRAHLASVLRRHIARTLHIDEAAILPDCPLNDAGLDSLMAAELRTHIDVELGVDVPMVEVVKGISLNGLVDRVARDLGVGGDSDTVPSSRLPEEFEEWVVATAESLAKYRADWDGRREVSPSEARAFMEAMLGARAELARFVGEFDPEMHAEARRVFRRHTDVHLLESAMFRNARTKPLGYPGDHTLMMRIYDQVIEGEDAFARTLDRYAVSVEPGARAVRNRGPYVTRWLSEALEEHGAGPFRVASLGCGPARELFQLLELPALDRHSVEVLLVDQDERALEVCRRSYAALAVERGVTLTLRRAAVDEISADAGLMAALSGSHAIYSTGLFDYFNEPTFAMALGALYSSLGPGGRLLVGNMAHGPSRWTLEYVTDWFLYYRDPDVLERLGAGLHPVPRRREVLSEEEGVNLFLQVQKP